MPQHVQGKGCERPKDDTHMQHEMALQYPYSPIQQTKGEVLYDTIINPKNPKKSLLLLPPPLRPIPVPPLLLFHLSSNP